MNRPVIVVHGGAGAFRESMWEACLAGCRQAALAGWERLRAGGAALDAVEAAVQVLEDDPAFDAGRGSFLNMAGVVQMDAIIMDGRTLDLGAVAAVERIRHPITLARRVMERSPHNFIVGPGAMAFAEQEGISFCDPDELQGVHVLEDSATAPGMDTVGAVAVDLAGNFAVATSTGGTPGKWPGRVGDSPLVGAGAYADNRCGAASATGEGEKLMRLVISKTACDRLAAGIPAPQVAAEVIRLLHTRVGGHGGLILVDREGRVGLAHNTQSMPHAYVLPRGEGPLETTLVVAMEARLY
ncbi:MAG TPA: isoaspartyl peptidase/L-asparaginase [Anaerolineae bacterium]|nr:isoaspartyl peptidase/L-asparaginase [Anaerolineae bacterium]